MSAYELLCLTTQRSKKNIDMAELLLTFYVRWKSLREKGSSLDLAQILDR